MLRIVTIVSLAALSAAPALAEDGKAPKEKKICRAETGTGTILRKRTCHTKAEWAQIEQSRSNNAQRLLDQRATLPGRTPGS